MSKDLILAALGCFQALGDVNRSSQKLAKTNASSYIVSALEQFPDSEPIQTYGTGAIQRIVMTEMNDSRRRGNSQPSMRKNLLKAGALGPIVDSMVTHQTLSVIQNGLGALWAVATAFALDLDYDTSGGHLARVDSGKKKKSRLGSKAKEKKKSRGENDDVKDVSIFSNPEIIRTVRTAVYLTQGGRGVD